MRSQKSAATIKLLPLLVLSWLVVMVGVVDLDLTMVDGGIWYLCL